jgi:hypothetical protein
MTEPAEGQEGDGASGAGDPRPEPRPGGRPDPAAPDRTRPSLTVQVRRRRTDQAFFLRLRDTIQQNHRALERIGT